MVNMHMWFVKQKYFWGAEDPEIVLLMDLEIEGRSSAAKELNLERAGF